MNDYESTQKKRNIYVGIFVLIALVAVVWLIYKFGDLPTVVSRVNSFQVYVQFPTAQGVQKDTPVRFCGYQIGRVTKIRSPQILRDLQTAQSYHQTVAILSIDKKFTNIPSNADIKVMTRGLGSSYIDITVDPTRIVTPRDPNRPETAYLTDKMVVQGSAGMTSEFFPAESQKKLDELITRLNDLIVNANTIIGDKDNQQNIKATLNNLTRATAQATQTLKEFETFSTEARTALVNTDQQIVKVVTATIEAEQNLGDALIEMRQLLENMNTGDGTFAKIVNDGKLYESLVENSFQLQLLLEEINTFVKKAKEKGIPLKLK